MYFIYKFMKNGYPIYIGKTSNLKTRFDNHARERKPFVKKCDEILISKIDSSYEMDVLETLLILKFKPMYNKRQLNCLPWLNIQFNHELIEFETYDFYLKGLSLEEEIKELRNVNGKLKIQVKALMQTRELRIVKKEELEKELMLK